MSLTKDRVNAALASLQQSTKFWEFVKILYPSEDNPAFLPCASAMFAKEHLSQFDPILLEKLEIALVLFFSKFWKNPAWIWNSYYSGTINAEVNPDVIVDIVFRNAPPGSSPPFIHFFGGGAGSGKTYLRRKVLENLEKDVGVVLIDADALKEYDWYYTHNRLMANRNMAAADLSHSFSSLATTKCLERGFREKRNIMFDTTLSSENSLKWIRMAEEAGYNIEITGSFSSTPVAVSRALHRALHTGRFIPVKIILETHQGFANVWTDNVKKWRKSNIVCNLFDTSKPMAKKIRNEKSCLQAKLKLNPSIDSAQECDEWSEYLNQITRK